MKKTTIMLLAPAVLLSMSAVGCRTPQRCPPRPCGVAQPCAPAPFPSPPNGFPGTRPGLSAPVVPPPALPPGAIPATPPPGLPPGAGAGQKVEYRWYPADSQVQLAPPEPVKTDDPSKDRILFTPKEPAQPAPAKVEPPVVRDTTSPPLPVGIPQFATVRDKVTAGLRPSLDDGLDWLQKNGYRTVLFIRAPGEDDNTDRKQAEKRGLAYLTLEVSPQTFNKQMVDDFNRLVGDAKLRPLFVYDRDGSLAGGLWYLHFRQVEQLPDDAARIRANALGLKENADGTHRLMWLAVQKYLGEAGR